MLYVCVRGAMDLVFCVCIVTRGAVGARIWEVCFCLPHPVFVICNGLCACIDMM